MTVQRSLPHGHVAAVLGMARAIGLDRLLGPRNSREPNRPRDLVMAMIVSRVIAPTSKLATAKALDPATTASSLGAELALSEVDEDELYAALDVKHQSREYRPKPYEKDMSNPFYRYDPDQCVLCGRCVARTHRRAMCQQIIGRRWG